MAAGGAGAPPAFKGSQICRKSPLFGKRRKFISAPLDFDDKICYKPTTFFVM